SDRTNAKRRIGQNLPRAPDDWDQRRHSCAGAESVWKQEQELVERCVNSVQT
ncbi:hypothetical protein pipiens_000297, partial [Culex pipiens pipiens]